MACLLKPGLEGLHFEVAVDDLEVLFGFAAEVILQLVALIPVMEELDGLFEADSDEEANNDGGDVDEEIAPGVGGVMGRVNVEHGVVILGVLGILGGDGRWWRRLGLRGCGRRRLRGRRDGLVLWHGFAAG